MEGLKNIRLKYLAFCSTICAITSISYLKYEDFSQIISRECNETIATIAAPQPMSSEKRLKYWPVCISEWNVNGNLRSMNRVFGKLNYEFVNGSIGDDWDILWGKEHIYYVDDGKPMKSLRHNPLKPHQKINHFPGNNELVGKSRMTTRNKHLKYIKPAFRPESYDELIKYARDNPNKKFVKKNKYNRGVRIVNASEIGKDLPETFYQEFLDNPFIVEKRAFDLGVFVLITSVNPLRVYRFSEEVLLRFCAEDYYPFDENNRSKYVVDSSHTSAYEMKHIGKAYREYKCTFKSLLEDYIKKKGFDIEKLWKDIDDAIALIVLSSEKSIIEELKYFSLSSNNFFELVRFDIILDENLNPYVMEVNMSPNITPAHSRFEENALIYEQLVYNTVNMIGGGNYHEFMSRHSDDTTIVHYKNIAVRAKHCIKYDCVNNCQEYSCRLCLPCLSKEHIFQFKEAYRENGHMVNFRRVFPTLQHFDDENLKKKVTKNNRIMIDWYREKCKQDTRWC